jgi:hypothetical protein
MALFAKRPAPGDLQRPQQGQPGWDHRSGGDRRPPGFELRSLLGAVGLLVNGA